MKLVLLFVLSLVGSIGALHAQTLTPAQAQADVQYLRKKMDQLYPGVGYYLPKSAYNVLYDSISHRVSQQPIDYQTFFQTINPLIADLKDGHAALMHQKHRLDKRTRFIPVMIRQADTTYYISHNLSSDTTVQRGSKLLTINGQPIAALHQLLQDTDRGGSDGDNLTGRRFRSLVGFGRYYAEWFGPSDSVRITYQLPADTVVRTARLRCETSASLNGDLKKRYKKEIDASQNLSVRFPDSLAHTAILRVSTFSSKPLATLTGRFRRQLRQAFQKIEEKNVQNLVVDVRGNGGGALINAARLLQYWIPQPFRIVQPTNMKPSARGVFVKWYNPFTWALFPVFYKKDTVGGYTERFVGQPYKPSPKHAYRGNLYFLVNGASYSATTTVLAQTLNNGLGTYVGEACGGAYWGDFAGHFKVVTLPNSGLRVRIPLKRIHHAVDLSRANGFTVEPDFPVNRTYEDIVRGRDFGMVYVLKLIQAGQLADRVKPVPTLSKTE